MCNKYTHNILIILVLRTEPRALHTLSIHHSTIELYITLAKTTFSTSGKETYCRSIGNKRILNLLQYAITAEVY